MCLLIEICVEDPEPHPFSAARAAFFQYNRSRILSVQPDPHPISAAGAASFNCSRSRKVMRLWRQIIYLIFQKLTMFSIVVLLKQFDSEPPEPH
jgi:hypothetical protein